jgi:hypothetical protein
MATSPLRTSSRSGPSPIAAALACLLSAAPSGAALPPEAIGRVLQATRGRTYLDSGVREGLAVGKVLELRRGAALIGRCTVETVSDHRATCIGYPARPGDQFERPGVAAKPAVETLRAAPLGLADRLSKLARLATVEQKLVTFQTEAAPGAAIGAMRADVQVQHRSWMPGAGDPWQREQVDLLARDVPLGHGLTLDLDLSARQFLTQPGTSRFRPNTGSQLYVWEAALGARGGLGLWGTLGRVLPWGVPGAGRFDGAQAGYRTDAGDEYGFYGGALPDVSTLAPSTDRGTVGGFWSVRRRGETGERFGMLLHQGRVALVATPEGGSRVEAEAAAQASITNLCDLSGDVRLGAGGSLSTGIEALRFDVRGQPGEGLTLGAGFRYLGVSLPQFASLGSTPLGGRSSSGDLSLGYLVTPGLQLSAVGGFTYDLTSGMSRGWFGPELSLPRFFGDRADLMLGYQEELGWQAGRSAWAQTLLHPTEGVRVTSRLSWMMDQRPDSGGDHQLALYGSVAAKVTERVELRVSLAGRLDPGGLSGQGGSAAGLTADAAVGGMF